MNSKISSKHDNMCNNVVNYASKSSKIYEFNVYNCILSLAYVDT